MPRITHHRRHQIRRATDALLVLGCTLVVLALLAIAATGIAHGAPLTRAEVVTGQDLSIRYPREHTCRWWRGQTATQPQRAAEFLAGGTRFLPEAVLYAEMVGGACGSKVGTWIGRDNLLNRRLRNGYVDISRDKEWSILSGGCPDYESVANTGEDLRACSTANEKAARACAASLYMTGDLLAWSDLRIEAGQCVPGARYDLVIPGVEDKKRALEGRLDYRVPLPALTPAQMALWEHALHVHHQADDAACGEGSPPPNGAVKAALLAFENSAVDERQRHAFQLHEFPTSLDPRWTRQEVCDLKRLEGAAMNEIDRAFRLPGNVMWAAITRTRASHETIHVLAVSANDKRRLRIGTHRDKPQLTDTIERSPRQWLACATTPSLKCKPAWLPDDWRTLVGPGGGM